MQAVFVRLKCTSTKAVLQELWDRRLLALHCGDSCSLNPDDYPPAGKHLLNRLNRYCRHGAIVAAEFRDLYPDRLLVGEMPPNSELRAEAFGDERPVYKVVSLGSCREISYLDFPVLLASRPQQGTLVSWSSAQGALRSALYDEPLAISLSSLAPDQVEILCYEYLRRRKLISRLLMPIGRGFKDLDVFGMDAHQRTVLAQIARSHNASENARKLANLLAYKTGNSNLYYFSKADIAQAARGVTFFEIEDVFNDSLDRDESRQMIFRMLGQNERRELVIYDEPREIDNQNLIRGDIPDDIAPIQQFEYFALSFDAYQYWERQRKDLSTETRRECKCLSHLRTRLFHQQRAGHYGDGLSRSTVLPLVRAIRRAVESGESNWC